MRLFWKLYLRLNGWRSIGTIPASINKYVMIIAPHTSSWDFIIGIAFRSVLRLNHVKFLGKKELFSPPFGFIFRMLGGTPVDRSGNKNMVDQVVAILNSKERIGIALSPEGTRKKADRLRTGFYHIAKKAAVPIIMVGLDYSKKQLLIAAPFNTSENEQADMDFIMQFFGPLNGKIPENGLQHLSSKAAVN